MNNFDRKIIYCIGGIMSNDCNNSKKNNYYHNIIRTMYGNTVFDTMQEMTHYSFDWYDADEDKLIDFLKEDEDYGYIVDDCGVMLKEVVEQIQEKRYKKLESEFTFA